MIYVLNVIKLSSQVNNKNRPLILHKKIVTISRISKSTSFYINQSHKKIKIKQKSINNLFLLNTLSKWFEIIGISSYHPMVFTIKILVVSFVKKSKDAFTSQTNSCYESLFHLIIGTHSKPLCTSFFWQLIMAKIFYMPLVI